MLLFPERIVRMKLGQKIIFLLVIVTGIISTIELITYRSLQRLDKRLSFVELADDLTKNILEMRRLEKNYFLYHDRTSLAEAVDYVHRIEDLNQVLRKEILELVGSTTLVAFQRNLREYDQILEDLLKGGPQDPARENELRTTGRRLYEFTKEVVREERLEIGLRLYWYQKLSLGSIIFITVFAGISYYLVYMHVVVPLGQIEATTRKIAHGDFTFIPEVRSQDEVGTCVGAFNRMVKELQENQDMLVQTKKLAALGTVTSGVAHELNNPLNNISTSCQIVMEELNSPDRDYLRKLLGNIMSQTDKARDIVRNLLEFSRERVFTLEPVKLGDLIHDTFDLIQSDIPSNVEIEIQVRDDIPDLMVDRIRVQQALLNLILNGMQAMPDGGKLTVRTWQDDASVSIDISDTGIGIPAEDLPRIFDPFFSTKDVGKGTGLGLSVSYGIIDKHGGRITVRSVPGRGTTFTIVLPTDKKGTGQQVV